MYRARIVAYPSAAKHAELAPKLRACRFVWSQNFVSLFIKTNRHITLFNLLIERTFVTHSRNTESYIAIKLWPSMLQCWNGGCVLTVTSKNYSVPAWSSCDVPILIHPFIDNWSGVASVHQSQHNIHRWRWINATEKVSLAPRPGKSVNMAIDF